MLHVNVNRLVRVILVVFLAVGLLPFSRVPAARAGEVYPPLTMPYPAVGQEIGPYFTLEEPGGAFISRVTKVYLQGNITSGLVPLPFVLDGSGTRMNIWVDFSSKEVQDAANIAGEHVFMLMDDTMGEVALFSITITQCPTPDPCGPDSAHYRSR